nr:MAG TPA: hypothetical protein [Caudoviricetes sp.]
MFFIHGFNSLLWLWLISLIASYLQNTAFFSWFDINS